MTQLTGWQISFVIFCSFGTAAAGLTKPFLEYLHTLHSWILGRNIYRHKPLESKRVRVFVYSSELKWLNHLLKATMSILRGVFREAPRTVPHLSDRPSLKTEAGLASLAEAVILLKTSPLTLRLDLVPILVLDTISTLVLSG